MKKKYLVKFNCVIGEHEYMDYYVFDKKKSEWKYCKEFWGIKERDSSCLGDNVFWDDWMQNSISVYSETEITSQQANILNELGVA